MRTQQKNDWEKGEVAEVGHHLNTPKPSTPPQPPTSPPTPPPLSFASLGSDLTQREGSLKQLPQLFGLQKTRRLLFLMNSQILACHRSQPFKNVFYCDTVVTLPNGNAGKQNSVSGDPLKASPRSVSKHCASPLLSAARTGPHCSTGGEGLFGFFCVGHLSR